MDGQLFIFLFKGFKAPMIRDKNWDKTSKFQVDKLGIIMSDNKDKALSAALGQIERQFGKGSIMRMGDEERQAMPAISTGSLTLDVALGIGGLPKGRIVEIYGPESSGKTTMTLSVIAESQKTGGTCAFIDAEHAQILYMQSV